MIKYDDVPSTEGCLQYDKNALHVKTFSGKYRPLIIFTNKNCQAESLLNFLIRGKEHHINNLKPVFTNKSTMEIRSILSNKICSTIVIEDHTEKELQDIIDVLNYYAYSTILLHSRKNITEKNHFIWKKLNEFNIKRAVLCVEDLYKGSVDLTIFKKIMSYLHIKLSIEMFTHARKYGIIKRVNNNNNHETNKHIISNIHINWRENFVKP